MNKILEYVVAFLALIGLGALVARKKPINTAKEDAKIDEVKKEIADEVNSSSTQSVVDGYNKRHGKS